MKINIFWFRRDIRLEDNTALNNALKSGLPVLPLFIFDTNIINELPDNDPRVWFIYHNLKVISEELQKVGSSLVIEKGDPEKIFKEIISEYDIMSVFINKDYEPYAIERDNKIEVMLRSNGIDLYRYKDQVIFEENEVLKPDLSPYTIFTPYMKRWYQKLLESFRFSDSVSKPDYSSFYKINIGFPSSTSLGLKESKIKVRTKVLSQITDYDKFRDYPAEDKTTYLSPHLRFGTVSIRKIVFLAKDKNRIFLNELIWREFFMQILFHYPGVVTNNFRSKYDNIEWRNDEKEFERWCRGETGYPIVDAGMRQLNATGYMHNRVRMITAGFLCKHLLIDWRWGEAYFAEKLLDYELSSNNGNWQWAAGTGCDAAPYFRVFNPLIQNKKYDPDNIYVMRWCRDLKQKSYPEPMVSHEMARQRAIDIYKKGIAGQNYLQSGLLT